MTKRPRILRKLVLGLAVVAGLTGVRAAENTARADDMVWLIAAVAGATAVPGYLLDLPQLDEDTSYIRAGGGSFDAIDNENKAANFDIEYQPGFTFWRLKPLVGISGNTDNSYSAYAALSHDFHVTKYGYIRVETGPAFYATGEDGKNLGSMAVLRSGFELGFRFDNGARIGGSLHHMSHGKLLNDEVNPGTEIISVNLSWPLP